MFPSNFSLLLPQVLTIIIMILTSWMKLTHLIIKICFPDNMHVKKITQELFRFKPETFCLEVVGGLWVDFEKRMKVIIYVFC